jgi:hypothetical protein
MRFDRLPETVQTLYVELFDQVVQAEAEAVARELPPMGSFVSKEVKGRTYWYLQQSVAGRREQRYLGPDSESLRSWMGSVHEAREQRKPDEQRRAELVDMLTAGGAAPPGRAAGRVLEALAGAGVFRLGAVLVGTHAFSVLGNLLGVRPSPRHSRTEDIDIAQDPRLAIALSRSASAADVPATLAAAEPTFFAVPGLDPRRASTSFKVRGRDLRVDFLTPSRGRRSEEPIPLPHLGVSAQPLPFLAYLLEDTVQAVVLHGAGVRVEVPAAARLAFHKLWVASQRPAAMQARAAKDRLQAEMLLAVLVEDRPHDLAAAWQAVPEGRKAVIESGLASVDAKISEVVRQAVVKG